MFSVLSSPVARSDCIIEPIYIYVLGILLCIGGILSYLPQYYALVKSKQAKGISELSLFILNIGSACLAVNSVILNWSKFYCHSPSEQKCPGWVCGADLLPTVQIVIGWIMVFLLHLIFVRYKIKNSDRAMIYDLSYLLVLFLFFIIVGIVGMTEKIQGAQYFFTVSAWVLGGIVSPICSCLVWIPQIIKLIRTKDSGNLSLLMFILQTPGSVVVIVFQVLYHQSITTWGTYVICLIEQGIIVVILIIYKIRDRRKLSESDVSDLPSETDQEIINNGF